MAQSEHEVIRIVQKKGLFQGNDLHFLKAEKTAALFSQSSPLVPEPSHPLFLLFPFLLFLPQVTVFITCSKYAEVERQLSENGIPKDEIVRADGMMASEMYARICGVILPYVAPGGIQL